MSRALLELGMLIPDHLKDEFGKDALFMNAFPEMMTGLLSDRFDTVYHIISKAGKKAIPWRWRPSALTHERDWGNLPGELSLKWVHKQKEARLSIGVRYGIEEGVLETLGLSRICFQLHNSRWFST